MCLLWIQTRVLMLVKQAVWQLGHAPSPVFTFFGENYDMWWSFCLKGEGRKEHACGGYGMFYLWFLRLLLRWYFLYFTSLLHGLVLLCLFNLPLASEECCCIYTLWAVDTLKFKFSEKLVGNCVREGWFFFFFSFKGLPHLKILPYFHWSVICFHGNRIRRWFLMIIFKAGSWLPLQLP